MKVVCVALGARGRFHVPDRHSGSVRIHESVASWRGGVMCGKRTDEELLLRDDEKGTWCTPCRGAIAFGRLTLNDLPVSMQEPEVGWAAMLSDFERAARECFPDRAEQMIAELHKRAPVMDHMAVAT